VSGTFCVQRPSGLVDKRYLTPFSPAEVCSLKGDKGGDRKQPERYRGCGKSGARRSRNVLHKSTLWIQGTSGEERGVLSPRPQSQKNGSTQVFLVGKLLVIYISPL